MRGFQNIALIFCRWNTCRFHVPLLLCMTMILAVSATRPGHAADNSTFAVEAKKFTQKHCISCHDSRKEKGDFRVDELSVDLMDAATAIAWQDVLDLVQVGEMPPEGKPQPSAEELKVFVDAFEREVQRIAQEQSEHDELQIRRLSRSAMDNTVHELLGTRLNLSDNLPEDTVVSGFDNLAATLGQSREFMKVYQRNARRIANDVIVRQNSSDPRRKRTYKVSNLASGSKVERGKRELMVWSSRGRVHCIWPEKFKAPRTGVYEITLDAAQSNTVQELILAGKKWEFVDKKTGKSNTSQEKNHQRIVLQDAEKLRHERLRHVSINAVTFPVEQVGGTTPGGREIGEIPVGPEMESRTVEVELEKGETFFIHAVGASPRQFPAYAKVNGKEKLVGELLRVKRVTVEGPLTQDWPPPFYDTLVDENQKLQYAPLRTFLSLLFREPCDDETVRLYASIYSLVMESEKSPTAGLRRLVEAALCSPRFLYVRGPSGDEDEAFSLANRLAYFLWNSPPDSELLSLAWSKQLLDPDVLERQVNRLLADDKSDRFVNDFTEQWLSLRKVGDMLPDPDRYPEYDRELEVSMRREPELLFREVLRTNSPIDDLLNPGYALINERLAIHYGIDGVKGEDFRKVRLDAWSPRGGLLGHASMLTITSDGTRTSPVVRGVWVLENLFDSPPSPPPADVEPIEPDVRGATTIREMLAKHRDVATCNECHRRIDPWGFGLENFNAVGQWRNHYMKGKWHNQKGKPVDATGRTPQGKNFNGVVEMRSAILSQSRRFHSALAAKLFLHAMGREPSVAQRHAIDQIVDSNRKGKGGLRDLIKDLCASPLLRGK